MKKSITVIVAIILLFAANASAVQQAESRIAGDFLSKYEYYIDFYMVCVGNTEPLGPTEFDLDNTYLTIFYNDAVLSAPTLDSVNPDLQANYTLSVEQVAGLMTPHTRLQITTGSPDFLISGSEVWLARIKFTIDPSAAASGQTAGISWDTNASETYTDGYFLAGTGSDDSELVCYPDISGSPDIVAEVGQIYNFAPTVSDVCGAGPLDYSITNKPAWAEFDTATGVLTGTPDFSDINVYSDIEITVTDTFGDAVSIATFDIDVTCPPAPTLSGAPVTSITAGNSYSFTPTVSDGCGALSFSITNKPSWASFDTATGALTGSPGLADVGTTTGVVIHVTDENAQSGDLAGFNIEVTAGCVAPVISGNPGTSIASGSAYSFVPTVSNGCGTLSFSITNKPSWAGFDTTTGALTGTPQAADANVYAGIIITVSDELDESSSLEAFDIQVTETDSKSGGGGGGGGGGGCFITSIW